MPNRVLFGVRPRNETAKSKERYAGRSITRISKKVQWTGHRSTIMIRALHMQYQIVTVNRIRWRRVLFHADGTNEKKWRSRWRQMIRGTRLDLLKVTETNQQNESNVSTERCEFTTCKVHKRANADLVSLQPMLFRRWFRLFFPLSRQLYRSININSQILLKLANFSIATKINISNLEFPMYNLDRIDTWFEFSRWLQDWKLKIRMNERLTR